MTTQDQELPKLRESLRKLVFKFAGGIGNMGDDEINAILDTTLEHLPTLKDPTSQYKSGYNKAISDMSEMLIEQRTRNKGSQDLTQPTADAQS